MVTTPMHSAMNAPTRFVRFLAHVLARCMCVLTHVHARFMGVLTHGLRVLMHVLTYFLCVLMHVLVGVRRVGECDGSAKCGGCNGECE